MEEHLELLSQIEASKKAKKEATQRYADVKKESEKWEMGHQQLSDQIRSLGHKYETVSRDLKRVHQKVNFENGAKRSGSSLRK